MATIYVSTTGNDSTGNGTSGNPYASPGKAAGVKSPGDTVIIQPGTYLISTTSTNVSGGCVFEGPSISSLNQWLGNGSVTLRASSGISNCNLFQADASTSPYSYSGYISNLIFDGNNYSNVYGLYLGTSTSVTAYGCTATNCYNGFYVGSNFTGILKKCLATANSLGAYVYGSAQVLDCVFRNNTGDGVLGYNGPIYDGCIASNNGGWGFNGQYSWSAGHFFKNCIAHNNVSGGFCVKQYSGAILDATIAYGNGGYGIYGDNYIICVNCATGANTSGGIYQAGVEINSISLSADPFISASTGDFNLNSTAGGGALLSPSAVNYILPW